MTNVEVTIFAAPLVLAAVGVAVAVLWRPGSRVPPRTQLKQQHSIPHEFTEVIVEHTASIEKLTREVEVLRGEISRSFTIQTVHAQASMAPRVTRIPADQPAVLLSGEGFARWPQAMPDAAKDVRAHIQTGLASAAT